MDWETFKLSPAYLLGGKKAYLKRCKACQFIGSIPKMTKEVVGTRSYFDFVDGDWVKDKNPQTFPLLIVVGSIIFRIH